MGSAPPAYVIQVGCSSYSSIDDVARNPGAVRSLSRTVQYAFLRCEVTCQVASLQVCLVPQGNAMHTMLVAAMLQQLPTATTLPTAKVAVEGLHPLHGVCNTKQRVTASGVAKGDPCQCSSTAD